MEQEKEPIVIGFCSDCGNGIRQGEKFCSNCGLSVHVQNVPKQIQPVSIKPMLAKNGIADAVKIIGIVVLTLGIIISFLACLAQPLIGITGILASAVFGIMFIGFAEIIALLQQNANNQYKIIELLWVVHQKNNK